MQTTPSPMSLASTWDLVADDYALERPFRAGAQRIVMSALLTLGVR